MNIIFCETAGNGSLTSNGNGGEQPMGDANAGGGSRTGKGEGEAVGDATEIMELNDINTFARYQIAFACRMDGFALHSSLSTPVSLPLSLFPSFTLSVSVAYWLSFSFHLTAVLASCCSASFAVMCFCYYCYFSALPDTDTKRAPYLSDVRELCDLW